MTEKEPPLRPYPIPPPTVDPTALTTQQLLREIEAVKNLLIVRIDSTAQLRDAKLDGLSEVVDAEFARIDRQFANIEDWRREQKRDMNTAVDRALESAEKAVAKSETSASEQSKQQYATFTASLKGVSDTLADVKDRVAKIEARTVGITEQKTSQRSDTGATLALLGGLFGLIGTVIAVISVAVLLSK